MTTLMKMWEGLGYYNRAKNLKRVHLLWSWKSLTARSRQKRRTFKASRDRQLYSRELFLPLRMEFPNPAVDGNVLRVLSRLWGDTSDIKRLL